MYFRNGLDKKMSTLFWLISVGFAIRLIAKRTYNIYKKNPPSFSVTFEWLGLI